MAIAKNKAYRAHQNLAARQRAFMNSNTSVAMIKAKATRTKYQGMLLKAKKVRRVMKRNIKR